METPCELLRRSELEAKEAHAWAQLRASKSDEARALWRLAFDNVKTIEQELVRRKASGSRVFKTLSSEPKMAKKIIDTVSRFVQKQDLSQPYTVLVVFDTDDTVETVPVPMSKDDMINFDAFYNAIQKTLPSFDKTRDCAWQHWTSVRSAWP